MEEKKYKYGTSGRVELQDKLAIKYSVFDKMYWLKEHAIFLYTWPFRTDNIIKYESSTIITEEEPIHDKMQVEYYKTHLKRYPKTLDEVILYRDKDIIQFLLDMSSALAFLHNHDIMHRDVKPSNIALTKSNRAVLLDFSHAHRMHVPLTRLDENVITAWYRSPEVYEYANIKRLDSGTSSELPYNSSVDIYSLGIILFEILTGKVPYVEYNLLSLDESEEESDRSGTTDGSKYGAYLQDVEQSSAFIKNEFNRHKRNFIFINMYWDWISKMIAHEPGDRITALDLYHLVKEHADNHNVKYFTPVNGVLEVEMPKLIKRAYNCDELFLSTCLEYLNYIRIKNGLTFNPAKMRDVIAFFITEKIIPKVRYEAPILAIAIIFETTVFDSIRYLADCKSKCGREVRKCIKEIISTYDQHLFGKNRIFDFTD